MLSDRPYQRGMSSPGSAAVAGWLGCALIAGFVCQIAIEYLGKAGAGAAAATLGLAGDGFNVAAGWKLATFGFLHSTGNLLHLAAVVAGVMFAGRGLQPHVSAPRMVLLFVAGNMIGAAAWLLARQGSGEVLVGSAAGAFALLALFASVYPDREYRLLVLFAFPVTLRPKQLLTALLSIDLAVVLIVDLLGRELPFRYAAPSHLGGALAGWCYYQFLHERKAAVPVTSPPMPLPEAALARPVAANAAVGAQLPDRPAPKDDLRARVDLILDKISSQGLASLTPSERRLLDEARTRLGPPR